MNILEGIGPPSIIFDNDTEYVLPKPMGPDRGNLRLYDFKESNLSSYISEGGVLTEIGRKFTFVGNLYYECANKSDLQAIWRASKEAWVWFVLNTDKPTIKYKVKVRSPKYKFTQGLLIGYSISVQLDGYEQLTSPGYGDLTTAGYGFDYGNTQSGQTP